MYLSRRLGMSLLQSMHSSNACMAARSRALGLVGRSRPSGLLHQQTMTLSTYRYKYTPAAAPGCLIPYQARSRRYLSSHSSPPTTRHLSTTTPRAANQVKDQSEIQSTATEPIVHSTFEEKTSSWQYLVADASTSTAVIIDPVLDYDPVTAEVSTTTADGLLSLIKKEGYTVSMILETHVHADHLTAASYLQARLAQEQGFQPPIGIGERISQIQQLIAEKHGIPKDRYSGVFGRLFADNEDFTVGNLTGTAIRLPGHTPDHLGYKIGKNIFIGDSLFNTDLGTARADFPGGDPQALFQSGRKLLDFPDEVKLWVGHDYPPTEREPPTPIAYMTVGDHKRRNKHLKLGVSEKEFVEMRNERDRGLAEPRLMSVALRVNICAGRVVS